MWMVSVHVLFILDIISLSLFLDILISIFSQTCQFESLISDGHCFMYYEVLPLGLLDLVRQKKYSCSQMNRIKIHATSRERQCVGVGAW